MARTDKRMTKVKRIPLNRNGVFYFRQVVSKRYLSELPELPKEVRFSLHTRSKSTAEQISKHVQVFLDQALLKLIKGKYMEKEIRNRPIEDQINALITLCKQVAQSKFSEIELDNIRNHPEHYKLLNFISTTQENIKAPSVEYSLSEVIKAYESDRLQGNIWTIKTHQENMHAFHLFQEIVGDLPFHTIRREHIREFKEILKKLPPNLNKIRRYANQPVREIINEGNYKTISNTTINKYLDKVISLFKWATDEEYTDKNCASRLRVKVKKKKNEKRQAFTRDDLSLLFENEHYIFSSENSDRNSSWLWIPLIGLYSGARLEEICQLSVDDIKDIDGISVIHINEEGTKRLKNSSSIRYVPIHPVLVRLGLLSFVRERKKRYGLGCRLFPELRRVNSKYGHYFSRWFSRYKNRQGVTDPRKVFHSLRHNFSDHLKQLQIPEALAAALTGHAYKSITYSEYGKDYSVKTLFETISKINYGIDLEHLKSPSVNPYFVQSWDRNYKTCFITDQDEPVNSLVLKE